MGVAFLHGQNGGSSELNFKVVGGTTQPSSPSSNTIWVNTGTAITGWVFSADAPSSPTAGVVWFKTRFGSSVPFNALKKNCLHVYPISVWQYASGAWAEKTAMIYADGTWSLVRALKEYLVQGGIIDMTAHTHTSTDNKFTATNSVTYNGKPSLALQGSNGGQKYHYFANVTVPEWAKTMKIECYRLAAYAAAPKISIGGASVTVPKTAKILYDITASIDVEAIAGSTGTFSVLVCGYADCYYTNIGNAWFE